MSRGNFGLGMGGRAVTRGKDNGFRKAPELNTLQERSKTALGISATGNALRGSSTGAKTSGSGYVWAFGLNNQAGGDVSGRLPSIQVKNNPFITNQS